MKNYQFQLQPYQFCKQERVQLSVALYQSHTIQYTILLDAPVTMAHSFIFLRDYLIQQIQYGCKCLAHIMKNLPTFLVVSYLREILHWLPVREGVRLASLHLGRAAIVWTITEYIEEICFPDLGQSDRRSLHSAACPTQLYIKVITRERRTFSSIGPSLWSSLSLEIRTRQCATTFKLNVRCTFLYR